MSINRRDFLKQSAFLLAAAGNAAWVVEALSAGEEPAALQTYTGPRLETWRHSVCRLCPGGCGIRIRLVDGQPVKIEGNPLSPVNRGGLCPTGHSGLQVLYHPERLKGPLRRKGKRGEDQWEPVPWEDALQEIADRLGQLRADNRPHHFLFLHGGARGLMGRLIQQFMTAYGSPNSISLPVHANGYSPLLSLQGFSQSLTYDFASTRFILSFGNDWLDAEGPPVWMAKLFGELRQNPHRNRIKLVQVDTRFSITAAKADRWLPVRPGTCGILALGIAYILIVEGLYDQEYIATHTFGFEDWTDDRGITHPGFKTVVLKSYYPERVSRITGVSIDELITVARSFAANRPSIALWGEEVDGHTNSFYSQFAVLALNALVGSLGKAGGIIIPPPPPPTSFPEPELDDIARWGNRQLRADQPPDQPLSLPRNHPAQLIENLPARQPYPVEVAFIYQTNPVHQLPEPQKVVEALRHIPFVVSFTPFMDETARWADLILPDHTYLEKWDLDYGVPYLPFTQVGLTQPVVSPRFNTRHTGDVLLSLAHRLGEGLSRSLPYQDYVSLLQSEARALFDSGRGYIPSGEFDEFMFEYMVQRGFRFPKHLQFEEFWKDFQNTGIWMENPRLHTQLIPQFKTRSGKFEFYSLELREKMRRGNFPPALSSAPREAQMPEGEFAPEDLTCLPHFETPQFTGDSPEYPLHLRPFRVLTLFEGEGANRLLLLEMVGFRHQVRWDSWAELHPETAAELGIRDGEWVWIESPVGKARVRVRLFAGAMPGVVYVPFGLGHEHYGKYATGRGINPNQLIALKADVMNGHLADKATRVRIRKVQPA